MRYFLFALLIAITSCSDELNSSINIDPTANISDENKYKWDEVYFNGEIVLLKKNNLPVTGFVLGYHENGSVMSDHYFINGQQEGYELHYFKNGSLKAKLNYKNGELDGSGLEWFVNGRKRFESFHRNGELDGEYLRWHENGQIAEISNYKNGLRIGWQRAYSENGSLMYEANLINGNGLISYRSSDNNIQVNQDYILGKRVNIENGEENDFGPFDRDFLRSGGKPSAGLWINSYDNGEKYRSIHKKNNSISITNFKHGLQHGKANETLNGQIVFEGAYFFDQQDGIHQSWYENGKLKEIKKYDKGILISAKCWDESGKEMECDCYNNSGKRSKCP